MGRFGRVAFTVHSVQTNKLPGRNQIRAEPDWAYEFSDRTPKIAGQVPPDQTESGVIFLNILRTKYGLPILIRGPP